MLELYLLYNLQARWMVLRIWKRRVPSANLIAMLMGRLAPSAGPVVSEFAAARTPPDYYPFEVLCNNPDLTSNF